MRADKSTELTLRAAQELLRLRKRVKDEFPLGPLNVQETPAEVAERMQKDPLTTDMISLLLKRIKETKNGRS